jgi:hypothetical protein
VLRYVLLGLVILTLVGLLLPFIISSREKQDRVSCQNHLRELGFFGVRHASSPGEPLPLKPRDELPPGTFLNPLFKPDERMSWFAYLLNALNEGPPEPELKKKHRTPAGLADLVRGFDPMSAWDSPPNGALASYRLSTAICPAQVKEYAAGVPVHTNYIANGGLGVDTPALSREQAGSRAGAYWYDGPTPLTDFLDGQRQTAQFIETAFETGPWLRGGPSTLRGLDPANEPYIGPGRPFGGCHPGGCYASMADGSVRFIKDSIEPALFRALLTRAGGPDEINTDIP